MKKTAAFFLLKNFLQLLLNWDLASLKSESARRLFPVISFILLSLAGFSQGLSINATGTPPVASAGLDIDFTNKGLLIPRMTQAQRDAITSPANSLLIYQTDNGPGYYYYNGLAWTILFSSSSGSAWSVSGNSGTNPAGNFIGTSDSADLVMKTSGTEWARITKKGKVGIGTATPEFKLSLDGDAGIIAKGTDGSGAVLTTTGAGARMIWYPRKSSFRAGFVDGTQWDDVNIGDASIALGWNNYAMSSTSVAIGMECIANYPADEGAIAIGYQSECYNQSVALGPQQYVDGWHSIALGGCWDTASGDHSVVIGRHSKADGNSNSIAIGEYVYSTGDHSLTIGYGIDDNNRLFNNIDTCFMIGMHSDIPTFFVGKAKGTRTIGTVGIGTTNQDAILEVRNPGPPPVGYSGMPTLRLVSHEDDDIFSVYSKGKAMFNNYAGNPAFTINDHANRDILRLEENDDTKVTIKDNGDIYLSDLGTGVILHSPDGNCWRLKVDNSGNVSSESVICP
jgi:hypothetical protein